MSQSVAPEATVSLTDLYQEIQQFYARQMHAIDGGDAVAWGNSFTEDGVFASNALAEVGHGRAIIEWGARNGLADREERGIARRHMMTMLAIDPQPDGTVATRSYVLVVETPRDGQSAIYVSTVCEDILVRGEDGGWQVKRRHVLRDDLPPTLPAAAS